MKRAEMRTTDCVHLNMELSRPTSSLIYLIIFLSIFYTVYEGIHQEIKEF